MHLEHIPHLLINDLCYQMTMGPSVPLRKKWAEIKYIICGSFSYICREHNRAISDIGFGVQLRHLVRGLVLRTWMN